MNRDSIAKIAVAIAIAGGIFLLKTGGGGTDPDNRSEDTKAGRACMEAYADNWRQVMGAVAGKVESGELVDNVAIRDYKSEALKKARAHAGEHIKEQVMSLNGKGWDQDRAAALYREYAK